MTHKNTIRDIAQRAGVGTTTVSRVLNQHPYVSEEKRNKVLKAIAEMEYRPSFSARWLRSSNSGLIGFLTDEVAITPYAVQIIKGAQEAAWQQGFVLLVVNANSETQTMHAAVKTLLDRQVEGILYAAMYHRPVNLPPEIREVPTVLANCFLPERDLPSVVPDEQLGGYNATRVLLEKGHRRIGFINLGDTRTHYPPPTAASEGRLAGYKQALAEYDIPFDASLLRYTHQQPQDTYALTIDLMELPQPPTALFCGNDRCAMSAYNALQKLGLRIPDDVAVVGFDNQVDLAETLMPTLTTVQLPHYEMGKWALEHLYLLANSDTLPEKPLQHQIACPLILRESV